MKKKSGVSASEKIEIADPDDVKNFDFLVVSGGGGVNFHSIQNNNNCLF
jgi:hypothetical protein